jgi:hypothetical protein
MTLYRQTVFFLTALQGEKGRDANAAALYFLCLKSITTLSLWTLTIIRILTVKELRVTRGTHEPRRSRKTKAKRDGARPRPFADVYC